MKILLAGGGSGGPVSPVLAVAMEIKNHHPKTQFLFVGTSTGPEKQMVEDAGIKFVSIPAARFRRFFTLKNIVAPFVFIGGLVSANRVVREYKPDVFFSAGGFVSVPLAWVCAMRKIRIVIHQQDAQIGLANKMIAPLAEEITTAFEPTAKEFHAGSGLFNKKWHPATWVGNPVRAGIFDSKIDARKYFKLHDDLPILLVLGGATGAAQINSMIDELLPDLVQAHQVIHQTGKGKNNIKFKHRDYHPYDLIPFEPYAAILKEAHLVIARAGLSTIAELSALRKNAIIIPMPNTHQEENAKILLSAHAAAVLTGKDATAENLKQVINNLKFNPKRAEAMERNIDKVIPKDATKTLANIIIST